MKESLYIAVPELDWLRDLVDEIEDEDNDGSRKSLYDKLLVLYRYLLWSRRYNMTNAKVDPETADITYGFVVKYHRLLYGLELVPVEKAMVEKAYRLHKKRLANG